MPLVVTTRLVPHHAHLSNPTGFGWGRDGSITYKKRLSFTRCICVLVASFYMFLSPQGALASFIPVDGCTCHEFISAVRDLAWASVGAVLLGPPMRKGGGALAEDGGDAGTVTLLRNPCECDRGYVQTTPAIFVSTLHCYRLVHAILSAVDGRST